MKFFQIISVFIVFEFLYCLNFSQPKPSYYENKKAYQKQESEAIYDDNQRDSKSLHITKNIQQNISKIENQNIEQKKRQIIYESHINLKTKQNENTASIIKEKTNLYKGYIESWEENKEKETITMKIRIPVDQFFFFLEEIFKTGEVISYTIKAEDVSKLIQDLESRLGLLRSLRERLQNLFKQTRDIKEKSLILKEINRITSEIEMLEAREKYYKDKASFSTITIYLSTKRKIDSNSSLFRSPFDWIHKLNPLKRTLFEKKKNFLQSLFFIKNDLEKLIENIPVPDGFFNNSKEFLNNKETHLFFSPDGSTIRVGFTDNEPRGEIQFWKKALHDEFIKRNYEIIHLENQNLTYFHLKISEGLNEYYYISAFKIRSDKIIVLEAFFPNLELYKKHKEKIKAILK